MNNDEKDQRIRKIKLIIKKAQFDSIHLTTDCLIFLFQQNVGFHKRDVIHWWTETSVVPYTAISRKVVGEKCARDNPER